MDPQNWSDERLDALLDQLAERAEERDDISLPGSGVTRRATLAGLLGLGGVAAGGAGLAAAIGESESYGSASGVVGTDSEPLQELNAKNGHFQSAVVDNTLETEQLSLADRLVNSGDFFAAGPSHGYGSEYTTSNTSYQGKGPRISAIWADWVPSGAQAAVTLSGRWFDSSGDVRIQNLIDSETVIEQTGLTSGDNVSAGPTNYTPTTTGSVIVFELQIRSGSGTTVRINEPTVQFGLQV